MPTCRKCQTPFPNRAVVEGKQRNLSKRKYCVKCSPFKAHNTRLLEDLPSLQRVCSKCGKAYSYKRSHGHSFATCSTCLLKSRHRKRKQQAIEYLGGRCIKCGYDGCNAALEFHHKHGEKDFSIGGAYNLSWERLRVELDKCELLCSNCHHEEHYSHAWGNTM